MSEFTTVALAGNPNAGKTTLFNHLTGARQHVGNYPGITVDHKEGYFSRNGKNIRITDLPGTYSLTAYSVEELVARDYLVNEQPQVVINIVDASNLERNLYLTCQFMELGVPMVIALNMMDVARDRGIAINLEKLEQQLGIAIIPIVARTGEGTDKLIDKTLEIAERHEKLQPLSISYGEDLDESIMELVALVEQENFLTKLYPSRFIATKYLEDDDQIIAKGDAANHDVSEKLKEIAGVVSDHLNKTMDVYPEAIIADHRYGFIKSIIRQDVLSHKFDTDRLYTSDKIDKIVTNRLLGPIIMGVILLGLYQFTFSWSEVPVQWLESLFGLLGDGVNALLPDGMLKSMIISGVIDGVGGVLGFVPLILFMFFGIAVLEDSGYLARVAFMMDRIFRIFGLHGSSVMPFIVSGGVAGGCAVPGVMATRTLRSPKERMATLLTVPFMNCGAKLPVLALLIGTFFNEHKALYMFLFTVLAWIVALIAAKVLRMTVLRGAPTPFVMELPPYRLPTCRGLIIHTWERTWQYIKKAGTVILGISILLWAMMTFPTLSPERQQLYDQQREALSATYSVQVVQELQLGEENLSTEAKQFQIDLNTIDRHQDEESLRSSYAGKIGTALEDISSLAGFDWRTNISLIGGFAAKEVIISTMGTAYSMGITDVEEADSLGKRLKHSENWNRVVALAAMVFIMFYAPCFVTIVCIAKESSWKWALFSMVSNTIFAFAFAVVVYQVGTLLHLA